MDRVYGARGTVQHDIIKALLRATSAGLTKAELLHAASTARAASSINSALYTLSVPLRPPGAEAPLRPQAVVCEGKARAPVRLHSLYLSWLPRNLRPLWFRE